MAGVEDGPDGSVAVVPTGRIDIKRRGDGIVCRTWCRMWPTNSLGHHRTNMRVESIWDVESAYIWVVVVIQSRCVMMVVVHDLAEAQGAIFDTSVMSFQ